MTLKFGLVRLLISVLRYDRLKIVQLFFRHNFSHKLNFCDKFVIELWQFFFFCVFWGDFGMILGWFWSFLCVNFEVILKCFCVNFGVIIWWFWGFLRAIMGLFWGHFGMISGWFWDDFWLILGCFLGWLLSDFGMIFEWLWDDFIRS